MQKWRGVVFQRQSLLALGASAILVMVVLALWKIPEKQVERFQPTTPSIEPSPTASPQTTQPRSPSQIEIARLEDEYRRTLAQIIGGVVVLSTLLFTWRTVWIGQQNLELARKNLEASRDSTQKTLKLSREGQITERFTKAIGQLGDDKLEVRLGGIYALERIAKDSEKDHWTIMEVLTAYIREHAPWQEEESLKENQPESKPTTPKPTVDIQAILTVLGRRERTYGKGESERLDLHQVNIKGADLRRAHLERANLWQAHLEEANFWEAHLEQANLWDTHLEQASLERTHLERANLWQAHLEQASLWQAHLEGANLGQAHLEEAYLAEAHLERADLTSASGVTQEQINKAFGDETTKLPEGLQIPEHWKSKAR